MLLTVLDGNGAAQSVIVQGQEAIVDKSSSITVTGTSQELFAANANRSGCFLQNVSLNPMWVTDLGVAAAVGTAYEVPAGGTFPPPGYPVTTAQWEILGTAGDKFVAREW